MGRLGRIPWPWAVGSALILAGLVLVLATSRGDPETLRALGTGLGIFGAAMILRTIGPDR
jgi:hypothetical protein